MLGLLSVISEQTTGIHNPSDEPKKETVGDEQRVHILCIQKEEGDALTKISKK